MSTSQSLEDRARELAETWGYKPVGGCYGDILRALREVDRLATERATEAARADAQALRADVDAASKRLCRREGETLLAAVEALSAARGQADAERAKLATEAEAARGEVERLTRERDSWERVAAHAYNGSDFYRGIVRDIGKGFGAPAYTSDDGSVQDDVLALRVPELVAGLRERLAVGERLLRDAHLLLLNSAARPILAGYAARGWAVAHESLGHQIPAFLGAAAPVTPAEPTPEPYKSIEDEGRALMGIPPGECGSMWGMADLGYPRCKKPRHHDRKADPCGPLPAPVTPAEPVGEVLIVGCPHGPVACDPCFSAAINGRPLPAVTPKGEPPCQWCGKVTAQGATHWCKGAPAAPSEPQSEAPPVPNHVLATEASMSTATENPTPQAGDVWQWKGEPLGCNWTLLRRDETGSTGWFCEDTPGADNGFLADMQFASGKLERVCSASAAPTEETARGDGAVYFAPHGWSIPCKGCGSMTLEGGKCVNGCRRGSSPGSEAPPAVCGFVGDGLIETACTEPPGHPRGPMPGDMGHRWSATHPRGHEMIRKVRGDCIDAYGACYHCYERKSARERADRDAAVSRARLAGEREGAMEAWQAIHTAVTYMTTNDDDARRRLLEVIASKREAFFATTETPTTTGGERE